MKGSIKNRQSNANLTLYLLVDKPFGHNSACLQEALKIIKSRFNLVLAFGFCDLSVFESYQSVALDDNSQLDMAMVSNDRNLFIYDAINFAKRFATSNLVIVNLDDLCDDLLNAIKFINCHINSSSELIQQPDKTFLYCSINYLRDTVFVDNESTYLDLFNRLIGNTAAQKTIQIETIDRPKTLFATTNGIARLGGIETIERNHLKFDSVDISDFGAIALIDDSCTVIRTIEGANRQLQYRLPSQVDLGKSILLFDINPVKNEHHVDKEECNFQRTILTIRKISHCTYQDLVSNKDKDALFIMSNFNKSDYIQNSLFSIISQTYENIKIEIVDDCSTDISLKRIKQFKTLLTNPEIIEVSKNPRSMGTYWIRNSIIHKYINSPSVYFVNDSDDYSSVQRASLQLASLQKKKTHPNMVLFADIIRTNKDFELLTMGGDVERYGTASLCCHFTDHKIAGYYENIKKDADTEFIVRVKTFCISHRVEWVRYPTLFQTFDGNNLTSDIYSLTTQGKLNKRDSNRSAHVAAFNDKHKRLKLENLPCKYRFPESSINSVEADQLDDYVLPMYQRIEHLFLVVERDIHFQERKKWFELFDYIVKEKDGIVIVYDKDDNQASFDFSLSRSLELFCKTKPCDAWVYKPEEAELDSFGHVKAEIDGQIIAEKLSFCEEGISELGSTTVRFLKPDQRGNIEI